MNRAQKISGIVAVVLLVAGGLLMTFKKTTPPVLCSDIIPRPTITAFGDSLVRGYGASTAGGFVTMLSNSTGVSINNLGRNGDTSQGAYERIDSVIATHAKIVVLLIGGNDALQNVSQATTEKTIGKIISTLQANGSQVLLLGVLGSYPFSDPYAPMFARLAKEYNTEYLPNVLSGIIGRENLMSDAVHPNEEGYQMIAKRVYPLLENECASISIK
jgi:acyl-CoA thioesterase-1